MTEWGVFLLRCHGPMHASWAHNWGTHVKHTRYDSPHHGWYLQICSPTCQFVLWHLVWLYILSCTCDHLVCLCTRWWLDHTVWELLHYKLHIILHRSVLQVFYRVTCTLILSYVHRASYSYIVFFILFTVVVFVSSSITIKC